MPFPLLIPLITAGASLLSGLGKNKADTRGDQNQYGLDNNRALANIFGTQAGLAGNLYGTQVGQQTNLYNTQAGQQQNQYNTQQQALLQALLAGSNESQQNAITDLAQRKFALDAPSTRASQAARGSLLQNIQDATSSGGSARLRAATPTISGGFRPSALGPGARQAGQLLEQGALKGLREGDTFDPLPKTDFQGGVLKPPGILPTPTPITPPTVTPPTLAGYQGPGTGESILGLTGGLLSSLFPGAGGGFNLLDIFRNRGGSGGGTSTGEDI